MASWLLLTGDIGSDISEDESAYSPEDETLLDRLIALRDILPPSARKGVSHFFRTTYAYFSTGLLWGGKALWVVGSSALLLGVPWALAYAEEQQLIEMERDMKMQQTTSEVSLTITVDVGISIDFVIVVNPWSEYAASWWHETSYLRSTFVIWADRL